MCYVVDRERFPQYGFTDRRAWPRPLTCARGAYDAVVDVGTAVDGDLQTVVRVVVLRRLVVRVELRREPRVASQTQRDTFLFIFFPPLPTSRNKLS